MNKFSALALTAAAFAIPASQAQDFTVLTTPQDVYANSTENVAGAKATFQSVLENAESTDADKLAAMQTYEQNATPAPGYAFDMTFLMSYTVAVNPTTEKPYTQAQLATAWQTDIEGLVFGANNVLQAQATYICLNSTLLKEAYDQFALYQNVTLSEGSYYLTSEAYLSGAAKAATLSAGDIASSEEIIGGGVLKDYSVSFKMESTETIKLGFKRNSVANLTRIYFNNVELYKVSPVLVISDDATANLAAAEGVDVQLNRTFEAGKYTPVCLPFAIENWKNYFADVLMMSSYNEDTNTFVFRSITGENTQARKPYLVKPNGNITEDNYLLFTDVTIQSSAAGSWPNATSEAKLVGNWAAGTVPANCYYLDGKTWKLSDGTVPQVAFSAYVDATALTAHPETFKMDDGSGTASSVEVIFGSDAPAFVNVYNLQGIMVKQNVAAEDALEGLADGIYIVNGKKVYKH